MATWMAPGVQGLDVSGWQAYEQPPKSNIWYDSVNWQAQWDMGARFAYIKATEGTGSTNRVFSQQYDGSFQAKMIRGAYHFALPDQSSAVEQANFFVDHGGGWSADGRTLPPLLDIEYNPYGDSCYNMAGQTMVNWIRGFSNQIVARTGRVPAIYTTTDWWQRCTGNSGAFADSALHIAAPRTSVGTLPNGWSTYSIWQYGDAGPFAGDSDAWNGDYAGLQRFATNASSPAAYTPPVDRSEKVLSVGDFDGDGKPDMLRRAPDGTLWFYPGNGHGGYGPARQIGSGWEIYDQVIGIGDYDGDGHPDILVRKLDGSLWFYHGTGRVDATSEGYSAARKVGDYGWDAFDLLAAASDLTGDGRPDLLARKPDGTLMLYPGDGAGGQSAPRTVGTGWEIFTSLVGTGDFNGDGKNDIVGKRANGDLLFYAGDGQGGLAGARKIGSGWDIYPTLLAPGDANGDGKPDLQGVDASGTVWFYAGTAMTDEGYLPALRIGSSGWNMFDQLIPAPRIAGSGSDAVLGRTPSGDLWFYPSTGADGIGAGIKIGTGWDVYSEIVGGGDFNGDGIGDLVARRPDGTLWFYAGTGNISASSEGYRPARLIGTGWNIFDHLVASGDLDGDGHPDLLGRKPDGSLWFYHGTGLVNAGNEGYSAGVKLTNAGWQSAPTLLPVGDYDSDGKRDVVGRGSDGTLWIYPGDGTGNFTTRRQIGTGWQTFDTVVGGVSLNMDGRNDILARSPDGSLWAYRQTGQRNEGYAARTAGGSL